MPKRTTKSKGPPARKRSIFLKERSGAKVPTPEEIERRAYAIFLARGGTGRNAVDDWLRAERELLQEKGKG